jgi:hypothetical protein
MSGAETRGGATSRLSCGEGPIWIGGGSRRERRSSGSIVCSAEFEASAAKDEGPTSSAGNALAVFGGAGAGRNVSDTRNPIRPSATTPKPIAPRRIGRTSKRRGAGTTSFAVALAGSVAGRPRPNSSGGKACRQVGYGFCPANRTRPRISLRDKSPEPGTCLSGCPHAKAAIPLLNTNTPSSSIRM